MRHTYLTHPKKSTWESGTAWCCKMPCLFVYLGSAWVRKKVTKLNFSLYLSLLHSLSLSLNPGWGIKGQQLPSMRGCLSDKEDYQLQKAPRNFLTYWCVYRSYETRHVSVCQSVSPTDQQISQSLVSVGGSAILFLQVGRGFSVICRKKRPVKLGNGGLK